MRVLITGAAGLIGGHLANEMKDRHEIRGLDRVEMPDLDDAIVGDIGDFDTVLKATEGMEAVIHLVNVGAEWEQAKGSMVGTYNVFEAARQSGARRVAYASRAGVLPRSFYPSTMQRTVDLLPKPDSFYTITKVFGESIGYMYSARHDMEVVAVRIGNFNRNRDKPEHPHHLSFGDCVRVFEQAIIHPGVKFEVVFGVSDSNWPLYDLDHGRKVIGYDPQDVSEVPEDKRVW